MLKHGVIVLTRNAPLEYASRGIRISAVCQYYRNTDARAHAGQSTRSHQELIGQPIGRLGHPEEIAAVVLWPCSPGSSFVIDHALAVDGGYTAR
jgi:NAD(P)-dependent dehydrogenase (short-subunit alcohol dehydrogenase family)